MALIDLLPDYYKNSPEVATFQNALDVESDALWIARNDLLSQLNVESATWGLAMWEKALGLETDTSKRYEHRRSKIMSKLRGSGTTTIEMIKNVAESFSNGKVDIAEHYSDYSFDIIFVGTMGTPSNMNDLTTAIEEIKPAHLGYTYIFIFRTNAQTGAYTHAQLSAYTHDALREGTM